MLIFFDSYGRDAKSNSVLFEDWCTRFEPKCSYNTKQLQSDHSNVCGLYCLYFLRRRLLNYSIDDIVNTFSSRDFAKMI